MTPKELTPDAIAANFGKAMLVTRRNSLDIISNALSRKIEEVDRLNASIDVAMSLIVGTPTQEDTEIAYNHLYDTRYGRS